MRNRHFILMGVIIFIAAFSFFGIISNIMPEYNDCPKQGWLQSDIDYCVELALFDQDWSPAQFESQYKLCTAIRYGYNNAGFNRLMDASRCKHCGICK